LTAQNAVGYQSLMDARTSLRFIVGVGGIALVASLFMPWAGDRSGWEFLTMTDIYFLIVGMVAVLAALTGGQIGVFRPDVSLAGLADLLSLVAAVLLAWLLIFDFPSGVGRGAGSFVALVASLAIAGAVGDYRVFQGAPWFPRLGSRGPDDAN
jgi:hypothetical protein